MPKKLNLSQRQIKAVQSSIEHWIKDIEKLLVEGGKICKGAFPYWSDLRWKSSNEAVLCRAIDCSLCGHYNKIHEGKGCPKCPYFLFYGNTDI